MILTNFSRQLRNDFLLLESTHTSPSVSAASTMCASYGGTGADAYINELWLHRRTCPRLRGHGHTMPLHCFPRRTISLKMRRVCYSLPHRIGTQNERKPKSTQRTQLLTQNQVGSFNRFFLTASDAPGTLFQFIIPHSKRLH